MPQINHFALILENFTKVCYDFFPQVGHYPTVFYFWENVTKTSSSKKPEWLISTVSSNSVVGTEVNCWEMAEKMRQFKIYQSFFRPIRARHVRRKVDW